MLSHQSLWLQIPEIFLFPAIILIASTLIKAASWPGNFGNDQAVDIATDIAVFAAGAGGAVFANDHLF